MAKKAKTVPVQASVEPSTTAPALLTFNSLSIHVTMGRSRIYGLIVEGSFPPPIKIGRSSRWLKSEIDAWIAHHASIRQAFEMGA